MPPGRGFEGNSASTAEPPAQIAPMIPKPTIRQQCRPANALMSGRMSLADRDGYGAVHRLALPLDFGREVKRPVSGHLRLGDDLINADLRFAG